eukprot:2412062-Karenia_brevis.AAC.1
MNAKDSKFDEAYAPNRTRIDFVLVNRTMWTSIVDFERQPAMAIERHVPYRMVCNVKVFHAQCPSLISGPPIDLQEFAVDKHVTFDDIWNKQIIHMIDTHKHVCRPGEIQDTPAKVFSRLDPHVPHEFDCMYSLICASAVAYLGANGAKLPQDVRRGCKPPIKKVKVGAPSAHGHALTKKTALLAKLIRQCRDLHAALKAWEGNKA